MKRRQFFLGTTLALASTVPVPFLRQLAVAADLPKAAIPPLPTCATECPEVKPIDAQVSLITGVYACTRPFRHAGPRIETERLGDKIIVHNYGHGGSGWSLSWGASTQALRMAQAAADIRTLGVIGCGPLGLTSAILAQRAGLSVRIYAKALPPDGPSMGATGLWSPDSRFCDVQHAADWTTRWKEMASTSFNTYQNMLGLPGSPVEWFNGYKLSDIPFPRQAKHDAYETGYDINEPEYAKFMNDFLPPQVDVPAASHPFSQRYARCWTSLMFNITPYAQMLMSDFLAAGGKIEIREFTHPHELLALPESTLINATGYGAKALFNDNSIIPVRGQTTRLIPQPEVSYGLRAEQFLVMPRRDGLVVQNVEEAGCCNNSDATPNHAEAEALVRQLAGLVASMRCR